MLHGAWKREFGCAVQRYPEVIYHSGGEEEWKHKCILKFKHGFSTASSIANTSSVRKLSRGQRSVCYLIHFSYLTKHSRGYFLTCVGFSTKMVQNSTQICSGSSPHWNSTVVCCQIHCNWLCTVREADVSATTLQTLRTAQGQSVSIIPICFSVVDVLKAFQTDRWRHCSLED